MLEWTKLFISHQHAHTINKEDSILKIQYHPVLIYLSYYIHCLYSVFSVALLFIFFQWGH